MKIKINSIFIFWGETKLISVYFIFDNRWSKTASFSTILTSKVVLVLVCMPFEIPEFLSNNEI
jgi:hypothetical protein